MRRNEAEQTILQDQVNDMSIEIRIARFESDLGHIKKDVANLLVTVSALQAGQAAANDAIASLNIELVNMRGEFKEEIGKVYARIEVVRSDLKEEIGKLREEVSAINARLPEFATKADLLAMEVRLIRWMIVTAASMGMFAVALATFAFTLGRHLH